MNFPKIPNTINFILTDPDGQMHEFETYIDLVDFAVDQADIFFHASFMVEKNPGESYMSWDERIKQYIAKKSDDFKTFESFLNCAEYQLTKIVRG